MTIKETVLKSIEKLPAGAIREDIQERINFMAAYERVSVNLIKARGFLMKR
ncbi:MAG: hypothetical protein ACP5SH_19250 [Syntrophobacteraceae bacterium]